MRNQLWYRQNTGELSEEWFFFLSPGARLAWIYLKAYVQEASLSQKSPGTALALSVRSAAQRFLLEASHIEEVIAAATESGALVVQDGMWQIVDELAFQSDRTVRNKTKATVEPEQDEILPHSAAERGKTWQNAEECGKTRQDVAERGNSVINTNTNTNTNITSSSSAGAEKIGGNRPETDWWKNLLDPVEREVGRLNSLLAPVNVHGQPLCFESRFCELFASDARSKAAQFGKSDADILHMLREFEVQHEAEMSEDPSPNRKSTLPTRKVWAIYFNRWLETEAKKWADPATSGPPGRNPGARRKNTMDAVRAGLGLNRPDVPSLEVVG